jgi:acetyltransferase-like isoleucine patch superfamily enzyme
VPRIHPTAEVSPKANIGEGTLIWHQAQVREGVIIGQECIISKGVYIDADVVIGSRVKIQNYACVYHGATVEDGVFIGPHVVITNDKYPRAITPDGKLKAATDWEVGRTLIREGASVGAGSVILPEVTIGRFALVGAGAVVTADVPDYGLVMGSPAALRGFVCSCGHRLRQSSVCAEGVTMRCVHCEAEYRIPQSDFTQVES